MYFWPQILISDQTLFCDQTGIIQLCVILYLSNSYLLYFVIFDFWPRCTIFFLSWTLFCDRTGSIQLCQFNFHSWQFDRLFVGQIGLSWNPFCAIEKSIEAWNWTTAKNPKLHKLFLQCVCQHWYIRFDYFVHADVWNMSVFSVEQNVLFWLFRQEQISPRMWSQSF